MAYDILVDIIIPLISSFLGVIGAYFVSLKLDNKKMITEEEVRIKIILDDFECRIIAFFSQVNNNGVETYTIFDSFEECVNGGREFTIRKETFGFENFSKPLINKIDNRLINRYNSVRQFYLKNLHYGQNDSVYTKEFYELIKTLNIYDKIKEVKNIRHS